MLAYLICGLTLTRQNIPESFFIIEDSVYYDDRFETTPPKATVATAILRQMKQRRLGMWKETKTSSARAPRSGSSAGGGGGGDDESSTAGEKARPVSFSLRKMSETTFASLSHVRLGANYIYFHQV